MAGATLERWSTWTEILSQPGIWRDWADSFDFGELRGWIAGLEAEEVWLSGAGSSSFIGGIVAAGLEGQAGPRLRPVASTDLVARPRAYLGGDRTPLVVCFGRSGNSSESVGTLEAIAALAPDAPMLGITCDPDSALGRLAGRNARTIVLPEAAHDSGFAMTCSFSTMLLTALELFAADGPEPGRLHRAADEFERTLPSVKDAVGPVPGRIVFLGTGPMAHAARESSLKVLELTAGRIPTLWDSVLGFRHGPKSFIDGNTRVVVLTGADTGRTRYEADLVAELRAQFPDAAVTTVGPGGDIDLRHPDGFLWAVPNAVLFAQIAATVWSDALGINVDDPFAGQGTLTRVVSGVKLYGVE